MSTKQKNKEIVTGRQYNNERNKKKNNRRLSIVCRCTISYCYCPARFSTIINEIF